MSIARVRKPFFTFFKENELRILFFPTAIKTFEFCQFSEFLSEERFEQKKFNSVRHFFAFK